MSDFDKKPGPTNRQVAITSLDVDAEKAARAACRAQGCVCGDALGIEVIEYAKGKEPEAARGYAKASQVMVHHLHHCPLLAAMSRN